MGGRVAYSLFVRHAEVWGEKRRLTEFSVGQIGFEGVAIKTSGVLFVGAASLLASLRQAFSRGTFPIDVPAGGASVVRRRSGREVANKTIRGRSS